MDAFSGRSWMASTYVLERRRKLVDLAARSAVLDYINMEGLWDVIF